MGISNMGKKAVMITTDSIIALTIVIIIIIVATNYAISSRDDVLPELQLVRTGNDILALFDNTGVFENMNESEVQGEIYSLIPNHYEVKINLTLENGSSFETDTFREIPDDRFIGTGQRVIVMGNLGFGVARFWIWAGRVK
ncbi:hypothetical protein ISS04_01885 [Candidatus Woesearchaeota archaeon]|nr:hypothetical protein [Candidatus Woesearchaeota archaeon]